MEALVNLSKLLAYSALYPAAAAFAVDIAGSLKSRVGVVCMDSLRGHPGPPRTPQTGYSARLERDGRLGCSRSASRGRREGMKNLIVGWMEYERMMLWHVLR